MSIFYFTGDFPETTKLIRRQVIRLAMRKKFMEILGLVKMTRGMRKIPKEDYEKWIEDQKEKNQVKRKIRGADGKSFLKKI